MPALITLGRVLFALPFIYSGATKLFGIQPTADFIAAVIPSFIIPYTSQLEAMTGMSTPQILAIAVGMLEVIAGLMIALNFGARFFAILLIFFVAATIYYFPPENAKTLMDALKSLSIIGALFIIVGYGRRPGRSNPLTATYRSFGQPRNCPLLDSPGWSPRRLACHQLPSPNQNSPVCSADGPTRFR